MSEDNGGPAFPVPQPTRDTIEKDSYWDTQGMSLRDWFAGQAMIVVAQMIDDGSMQEDEGPPLKGMAKACYELADAMLRARVKEGCENE